MTLQDDLRDDRRLAQISVLDFDKFVGIGGTENLPCIVLTSPKIIRVPLTVTSS